MASLPTKIIGNCLVLLYQDCSVGESKVEAHLVVSIHTVADTQDALGRPDAGEEDGHRSKEADRKGEAKEADLARQRGQRTRLQAEAMANALKVGLAGGTLEDGFPDFSRFWFCPLYVGARSIPWPMADVVAKGGIGRLRVPRGASGTRYVSMAR